MRRRLVEEDRIISSRSSKKYIFRDKIQAISSSSSSSSEKNFVHHHHHRQLTLEISPFCSNYRLFSIHLFYLWTQSANKHAWWRRTTRYYLLSIVVFFAVIAVKVISTLVKPVKLNKKRHKENKRGKTTTTIVMMMMSLSTDEHERTLNKKIYTDEWDSWKKNERVTHTSADTYHLLLLRLKNENILFFTRSHSHTLI